jgi:hypothetical protein
VLKAGEGRDWGRRKPPDSWALAILFDHNF